MRTTFINTLIKMAKKDERIILVVGDLGFNVVEPFQKEFPKRFFNAGVSEQNMASFAAGLASQGFKVFIYSIANFPTFRCAEQIRNDIDYHNLNVTIVTVGGGYAYGNLGYSHHAVQDYGLIRLFPNFEIFSPGDPYEVQYCLDQIFKINGPAYLRLNKDKDPNINKKKIVLKKGNFNFISKKKKKLILTTGSQLSYGRLLSSNKRFKNYQLASCPIWSHNQSKSIANNLKKFNEIIVIEDHYLSCGFSSFLLEIINKNNLKLKLKSLNPNEKNMYIAADQKNLNKIKFKQI